jgi:hypothetical protein
MSPTNLYVYFVGFSHGLYGFCGFSHGFCGVCEHAIFPIKPSPPSPPFHLFIIHHLPSQEKKRNIKERQEAKAQGRNHDTPGWTHIMTQLVVSFKKTKTFFYFISLYFIYFILFYFILFYFILF